VIAITGISLISAVGLNGIQSCASIRAGIAGFREWEGYFCPGEPGSGDLEPLVCARVPRSYRGVGRVAGLMASAAQELMHHARLTRKTVADLHLLVSLPGEKCEEVDAFLARSGIEKYRERKVHTAGHAGGLLAIREAMDLIGKGARGCLVIGSDSYLDDETLERLHANKRLKCAAAIDGFVPGEAAAAVMLEDVSSARKRGAEVLACVDACGAGVEKNVIASEKPSVGGGLSEAIRNTVKNGARHGWVVCDLNGESYRAREWGYARVRLNKVFEDEIVLWHPADCIGDVGAASGVVLAVVAARAFQRGYAPEEKALLWASSDGGERAGVVVRKG
jgi:3-oxoacyl-[acyl-carrier-protein] synthase-1